MSRTIVRRTAIASVLALIAVSVGIAIGMSRRTAIDQLIEASRSLAHRPIEARVSGFPFGEAPKDRRSINTTASLTMRAAAADIMGRDSDGHAVALAELLSGNAMGALSRLESIAERHRDDARYWNDVSAASLEVCRRNADPLMAATALAAADRSLDLQPALLEASFNRALSLESLGLMKEAARAHRHYLAHDPSSQWAGEVRERLRTTDRASRADDWNRAMKTLAPPARLEPSAIEALAARFPQHARTFGEGVFLAQWAEALLADDSTTTGHWLELSRLIGSGLRKASGESLLADAVHAIDSATPAEARVIASAHLAYREGRILVAGRKPGEATPVLAEAERSFAAGGSPMALVAAYFRANTVHDTHDREGALEILDRLSVDAPARYRALRTQLHWLRAIVNENYGLPFDALASANDAIRGFDALGDVDSATRMRGMKASLLTILGRDSEAWQHRARAFRDASSTGTASVMEVVLNSAARDEIRLRRWNVARALLRLELSRPAVSPRLRADALTWLAFVDAQISGRPPDFSGAESAAAAIADKSLRAEALNEVWFAQAVHQRRDAAHAVSLLTNVIQSRLSNARPVLAAAAHVERARAYRELKQDGEAESDLRRAITIADTLSTKVPAAEMRDTYFGASHDAHLELFDLLAAQNRFDEAFETTNHGRARLIADRRGPVASRDFSIAGIQQRLPPDALVAQFTATETRVVIITVSQKSWQHRVVPIGRRQLMVLTEQLTASIQANDSAGARAKGRELHRYLIEPIAGELGAAGVLAVSSDSLIAGVPFAALPDDEGRWLIERVPVVSTASASFAPLSENQPGSPAVTAVADPAFNQTLFPDLQRLRAAESELVRIRRMFPNARTFAGSEATRAGVTDAWKGSDLIHIGAHAFSDPRDASRSILALAPAPGDNGVLYAGEVAALDFDRAPLVVLAGCHTGALGGGRGNVRSLALAFLAAGSRGVVGTLWNIDDTEASAVTVDFYRHLREGGDAAKALRAAQLDALKAGRGLRTWAAFQIHVAGN